MPPGMNAPPDTWLMMRPPPRSSIAGTAAREHTSAPITLTFITRSHQSSGRVRIDPIGISFINAALLMRMSTPPNSSLARCTIAAAASSSVMSTGTPIAWRPCDRNSWACCSARSPLRSASTTAAPAALRPRPYSSPQPPAPPVTIATLPSNEKRSMLMVPPNSTGSAVTIPVGSWCSTGGGDDEGDRSMKIGVMLAGMNPKFWTAGAQAADEAGFESVWLPEHLVFPVEMKGSPHAVDTHPPIPSNTPAFDALMSLSAIAAVTKNLRLGTNVYNIGLRHPFVTARAIATLDVLSGGRVEFGIGASWLQEEWEATGLDFHTRGRRVDETIDICRRLWSEDVVEHHGEFFDFAPVMFNPKPVQQPRPSLLIGGDGAAAKRRAALVGDGWLPMNHTLEQLPAAMAEINEQRAAAGRDGETTLTIGGAVDSPADVDRYRDAGVDRVVVRPFTSSREALDEIRRYGDETLAKLAL